MNTGIKPQRLKKGSTIGIISPCIAMSEDRIASAAAALRQEGFRIKYAEHLFSRAWDYAGSIEERAEDFNAMIADPAVDMLLFGGGEVSNELLPYLDYDAIRDNPKIICSYSDSTTLLNAITQTTGLVTFYGASPRTFFGGISDYNASSFRARLMEPDSRTHMPAAPWRWITKGNGGICRGILSGGYLVNYAALQGLPWFSPDRTQRTILFLEDHEKFSAPSVVAKWFANLAHRGVFENADALIFGHYSDAENTLIDDILRRIGDKYRIPVARCEDFGHGSNNAVLPIGIHAALDTDKEILTFTESCVL